MISRIRSSMLLEIFRGEGSIDLEVVVEAILDGGADGEGRTVEKPEHRLRKTWAEECRRTSRPSGLSSVTTAKFPAFSDRVEPNRPSPHRPSWRPPPWPIEGPIDSATSSAVDPSTCSTTFPSG